jgi:hypothetical protein
MEIGFKDTKNIKTSRMLSSGLFPGICSLNANVSEHCLFHLHRRVDIPSSYLLAYEDGTDRVFRNVGI